MARTPVLQLRDVHVWYKEVHALHGIDLELLPGEIHAVIGERRAGKSSLLRLIDGEVRKTKGDILINGRNIPYFTAKTAYRERIGVVRQSPSPIPALSVIENVYLGRLPRLLFNPHFIKSLRQNCEAIFTRLQTSISLDQPARTLTAKEREMVELARAFLLDPRIILLDEISPRLSSNELETVFGILREYRRDGRAVLYIANNLDEVMQIADRITVLKNGRRRGTESVGKMDRFHFLTLANNIVFNLDDDEKAENVLSLIELFNEALINDLPLGIITLTPTGQISLMNWAARKILNVSEEQSLDRDLPELLSEMEISEAPEIAGRIAGLERYSWSNIELTDKKFINLKTFPLRDEKGVHVGSIVMFDDVSMDHFVEEYLLRAEKITSLAELAAGVAHEINNPLGIIRNYVVLLRAMSLGQEAQEHLAKIEKELGRIVETIGSLLSYSRSQQNPVRSIELNGLVDETLLLLQHVVRNKSISLRATNAGEKVFIRGDENKLKQLLVNLVMNSIEATPPSGSVSVDVSADLASGEALITIADSGTGIPSEIAEDIFTPFFTTKMNRKNIGLGLSICQSIAESHGGTISFVSDPAEGTRFSVRLPIS